ncbi:hypothetical protein ABT358_02290 [Streptomyces sp. NPDC000341]|uniref:hypothetical protein n=1 Tax=Streptomyces sp. NPDC000341 TaxID=3156645 RepID=UPI00331D1008
MTQTIAASAPTAGIAEPSRLYVEVETIGDVDRFTVYRLGASAPYELTELPRDAARDRRATLDALGWSLVRDLTYFPETGEWIARVVPAVPSA